MRNTVLVGLLIAVILAAIWLQIFLSKKENKWLGLLLPFISFVYSLLMVVSIAILDSMTKWEIFVLIASTLFMANIPTVILLAIYFGCREKIRRKKALEKMNIRDLE